ncbi:MAG: hypothetical protein JXL80_09045 [Planctomycetes bacterium]|nr:hypothetical protein [Planctomycetota bacterium]
MRITRVDIEGRQGRFATLVRKTDSEYIEVTVLTPEQPDGEKRLVHARSGDEELWDEARRLQAALDGRRGTNGDIDGYYRELQRLAD